MEGRNWGVRRSSGAHDRARDADDIPPANAPGLPPRSALLAHADMAPKCPRVSVSAGDVHADARRGLRGDERGGYLWRVGGESAQRDRGGADEARGKAAPAEGGEYAEREHVHLKGERGSARCQV